MPDDPLDDLRDLLRSGPVWGAEVDTRFRVLALTVEPGEGRHPDPSATDRRLQVLFHPVGRIAASLVEVTDDGPVVRRFAEELLPDVVSALDGALPQGDPLPPAPPDLDALAPRLSLRGEARTGDGTRHHLHLHLADEDLTLDLWAAFDDYEVRPPNAPEGQSDAPLGP